MGVAQAIMTKWDLDSTSCGAYACPFVEIDMIAFEVKDMTCGHCVSAITQALKAVDGRADVTIDLTRHRVEITAATASAAALGDAIREAGYTPEAV